MVLKCLTLHKCVIKMYNQFNLFKQGQCKNIIDAILFLPSFIKPCLQFALSPQYFQDRSYLSILEESCLIHPLHFPRSLHSYSILSACYFASKMLVLVYFHRAHSMDHYHFVAVFYLSFNLLFCLQFSSLLKNYLVIITDYPLCFPNSILPFQNYFSLKSDLKASLENTEAEVFLEMLVQIFNSQSQFKDFF